MMGIPRFKILAVTSGQNSNPLPAPRRAAAASVPEEVLIVASRLKDYVRARAGFNTSDQVLAPLSDIVRRACDEAIKNARRHERMTVLERDIPKP